jgi:hypothetical protein
MIIGNLIRFLPLAHAEFINFCEPCIRINTGMMTLACAAEVEDHTP